MTIEITPGPLPDDGTRINIESVLSAFVSGTQIVNFGVDDFSGGDINFVVSATDPPATDSRTRATLWYKRGEGRLYKWEIFPFPTGTSGTTDGAWLAMSDRRDVLVKQVRTVEVGDLLTIAHDADTFKMELAQDGRWTALMQATGSTDIVHLLDPFYVALTTDPTYAPAVEWGFCTAKITGTGQLVYAMRSTDSPTNVLLATGPSGWTNSTTVVGILSESGASETAQIFLRAMGTNMVR